MKLGVAYNIFSGAELLKPAIQCVRPLASYIVVVYSEYAITGERAPDFLLLLLNDLHAEGLVDELVCVHTPSTKDPLEIQNAKRFKYDIGRCACLKVGCTHFMGRDVDEFFLTAQLAEALKKLSVVDSVLCPLYNYVKDPTYKETRVSALHVSAFQSAKLPYVPVKTPVLLDMSRTVLSNEFYVANENELVMHHMTGVRFNEMEMMRKYQGHSHYAGEGKGTENMYAEVDPMRYVHVLDIFGIRDYWEKEFVKYYG